MIVRNSFLSSTDIIFSLGSYSSSFELSDAASLLSILALFDI